LAADKNVNQRLRESALKDLNLYDSQIAMTNFVKNGAFFVIWQIAPGPSDGLNSTFKKII
jgi:hypothetical protein